MTHSRQGAQYFLADPVAASYSKLTYIQYLLLRFFQRAPATVYQGAQFMETRAGVEVEESSIEHFLMKMADKAFLEPDRHVSLSMVSRFRITSRLKDMVINRIRRDWRSHAPSPEEMKFLSEVIFQLRLADPVGVLEICQREALQIRPEIQAWIYNITYEELVKSRPAGFGQAKHMPASTKIIPLYNPEKLLRRLKPFIDRTLSPLGVTIMTIFFLYSQVIFWKNSDYWIGDWVSLVDMTLNNVVLNIFIIDISVMVHEAGHAVVCARFGGRVRRIGVMVFWGMFTAAYADVSDSYFLPLKKRIMVYLGGVLAQGVLWALWILIWQMTVKGSTMNVIATLFCLSNSLSLLSNLSPFSLKKDGYYIFSDLIGVDNLFARSREYCLPRIQRFFGGKSVIPLPQATLKEAVWFYLYFGFNRIWGSINLLVMPFFFMAFWSRGSSLTQIFFFLAFSNLFIMLVGALKGPLLALLKMDRECFVRTLGGIKKTWTLAFLAILICAIPIRATVHVNGQIVPSSTASVRAKVDGLLESLPIREGGRVRKGDLIAQLTNPRLEASLQKELFHRTELLALSEIQLKPITPLERSVLLSRVNVARTLFERERRLYEASLSAGKINLMSEDSLLTQREKLAQIAGELEISLATFQKELAPPTRQTLEIERNRTEEVLIKLHSLRADIAQLTIRAPMDGEVTTADLHQSLGKYVRKGEEIVSLASNELGVEMSVPETKLKSLAAGDPFSIVTLAGDRKYAGTLTFVPPLPTPDDQHQDKELDMIPTQFPPKSVVKVMGRLKLHNPADLRIGMSVVGKIETRNKPFAFVMVQTIWHVIATFLWVHL